MATVIDLRAFGAQDGEFLTPDSGTDRQYWDAGSLEANEAPDTDLACNCPACAASNASIDNAEGPDPLWTGPGSAVAEVTLADMASFLTSGYWGHGAGQHHNLGAGGLDPNGGVLHYNVSGFDALSYGGGDDTNGISETRATLVRDVFDVFEAVLGIDFVETNSDDDTFVDFFFSDNSSGAYCGSTLHADGTINYSYINIAKIWSGSTATFDDYTLQTIFHEIGHALGLGHPGNYNGSASYDGDVYFKLDSWQATMMSYFSQTENSSVSASFEYLQTPMGVDWLALDFIYSQYGYGTSNAFEGDTTYGFNTNIPESTSAIWNAYSNFADRTASTIVDSGGTDTLDFSGFAASQKIDLTVQSATQAHQNSSDIGGSKGNLTLAVGTVIENAIGGSGDDRLIGNQTNNVLKGSAGNDTLKGFGADDMLVGSAGKDKLFGNRGNDALSGGRGRDKLCGGSGDDVLKGARGEDRLAGGTGDDLLTGGKESDTFAFKTGCGVDTITDFDPVGTDHDILDLSTLSSVRNWKDLSRNHLETDGTDVVIDGRDGDEIVLQNVDIADLGADCFAF